MTDFYDNLEIVADIKGDDHQERYSSELAGMDVTSSSEKTKHLKPLIAVERLVTQFNEDTI